MERLEKALCDSLGISRKEAKILVKSGSVLINGAPTKKTQSITESDEIKVNGELIKRRKNIYLMLNKAAGSVCTKSPDQQTIFDDLPSEYTNPRVFDLLHSIGRLDKDTTGLLILTTDGNLTHRIISEKSRCEKTYLVTLQTQETAARQEELAQLFAKGMQVPREGREQPFVALPARLLWLSPSTATLTLTQGKFHQVKRMFQAAGNCVCALKRISIGALSLDENLLAGSSRPLSPTELELLFSQKGENP